MKLSNKKIDNLKKDIQKITSKSVGTESQRGLCFSTTFALSIYLESKKISNVIVGGKMNGFNHFWLKLRDYDDLIIDATIKQFDDSQNDIYIGKLSDNIITRQYEIRNYSRKDWFNIYALWCNPEYEIYGIKFRDKASFKRTVLNNLINASILLFEIEKLDISVRQEIYKSNLFYFYFKHIQTGIRGDWLGDEVLVKELNLKVKKEFSLLLSKVNDDQLLIGAFTRAGRSR